MWKNYLKTTLRNLFRNRLYAGINILGLTIGITCFALIILFVENELSFDQFHEETSYRFLATEQTGDGESRTVGILAYDDLHNIAANVAGVKDVCILRDWGAWPLLLQYKDKSIKSRSAVFGESDFLDYFSLPLLQGDRKTALEGPNNVILSKEFAEIIFGDQNPMGEIVNVGGNIEFSFQVAGVFEKVKNSHLDFDILFNIEVRNSKGNQFVKQGFSKSVYGYYKLEPNVDIDELAHQVKTYFEGQYANNPSMLEALEREHYTFQPIDEIYFNSAHVNFDDGMKKGSKENLYLLSAIAAFILLIACMNYINAATAKAANRAKEIGVRKVFGAFRQQLVFQFVGEAFTITFVSVLLSVLLTDIAVPAFENLLQTEFRFTLLQNPLYGWALIAILLSVTLLSGAYPALVLSHFKPSDVLKSQSAKGLIRGNGFRSLLVGIQLFLTMLLISGVLLILKQSAYINSKDLGFSKNDILIVPNNSDAITKQMSSFKNELLKSPYITNMTSGMDVLGFDLTNNSGRLIMEGEADAQAPITTLFTVGMDYLDIQGIELIAGRNFNPKLKTDSTALIVNEAYMRAVGASDVVGKKAHLWSSRNSAMPIIGVVKDFNFRSLRSEVSPAAFRIGKGSDWFFTLKIDPNHKAEVIEHLKASWEPIEPNFPVGYMFLEDNLKDYYGAENRLRSAIQVFALICIFIACLGLYGLTAYTLERRIKEIGVRKVLGAHITQLVWMVNSRFVKIVLIASILAIPLVYYLVGMWLGTFAYRTEIGWQSFAFAMCIVLSIVVITVSSLAYQAGQTNPSKILRSE